MRKIWTASGNGYKDVNKVCVLMKKVIKIITFFIVISMLVFIFSCTATPSEEDNNVMENKERRLIIDSIFGVGEMKYEDKDAVVIYQESVDSIDGLVHMAANGAAKGGGVGALVLAAQSAAYYNSIEIVLEAKSFAPIKEGIVCQFALDYPLGSVRFLHEQDISSLANGPFSFKLARKNNNLLDTTAKKIIEDRPIMELELNVNNKPIRPLKGGIQIEIPYEPLKKENINQLAVYKVDELGRLTQMKNSICKTIMKVDVTRMDSEAYYLQALISEPGIYAIGYENVFYSDVSGWYEPYVKFVAARDIMNDFSGLFKPNDLITRGDLAYFLANMGEQITIVPTAQISLSDVPSTHPYYESIVWAYSTGIINGYADGTFRPNQNVTRQELAAMLYCYTQIAGRTYMQRVIVEKKFKDENKIEPFAQEAVSCLQQAGIITGKGNDYFDPLSNVTRAECAKMLMLTMDGILNAQKLFVPIN